MGKIVFGIIVAVAFFMLVQDVMAQRGLAIYLKRGGGHQRRGRDVMAYRGGGFGGRGFGGLGRIGRGGFKERGGGFVRIVRDVMAQRGFSKALTCNKCSYGFLSFCLSSSEMTCSTNTSLCFTGKISFVGLSNVGFSTQGCHEPAGCNATTNGTLLGITYEKKLECCSTDKCNPVQLSGAPSTKMTLTSAIGVAVVASMWGSIM